MSGKRFALAALAGALVVGGAAFGCGNSSTGSTMATGTGGAPGDASPEGTTNADASSPRDASVESATGNAEASTPRDASAESAVDSAEAALDEGDAPVSDGEGGASESSVGDAAALEASSSSPDAADLSDGAFACDGPGSRYVTDVVSFAFGSGQNFGQNAFPANIFGPPKGGGISAGSLDVVSLGSGGSVTVAFADNAIVDGPGPDFIVFENAFDVANDPTNPYAELGIVEVSQDGATWYAYPCTATQYPYGSCAGWHPVFANPDENSIDPTDPTTAGGDPFDLADLGLDWVRYVRVTDRPDDSNVFDLDAVAIVHPRCP